MKRNASSSSESDHLAATIYTAYIAPGESQRSVRWNINSTPSAWNFSLATRSCPALLFLSPGVPLSCARGSLNYPLFRGQLYPRRSPAGSVGRFSDRRFLSLFLSVFLFTYLSISLHRFVVPARSTLSSRPCREIAAVSLLLVRRPFERSATIIKLGELKGLVLSSGWNELLCQLRYGIMKFQHFFYSCARGCQPPLSFFILRGWWIVREQHYLRANSSLIYGSKGVMSI